MAALHSKAVDYVKTGEMVVIPQRLRPPKWPHYMEKDHLRPEKRYVSKKVLGKLYDQVERVDFVAEFDAAFDARILEAYEVSDRTFADAAGVKELYDAAMHRIMAQQAIKTEFEVWSTFVLSHANQSNDYKFHEEMGNISAALKDRFRMLCYEKAGGKDFDKLGPFVAAMYKVTSDQMAQALKECQQVKFVGGREERVRERSGQTMPLMSFPWIFPEVLGKIASGKLVDRNSVATAAHDLLRQGHQKMTFMKKKHTRSDATEEDMVQTAEGITQRGELLELFQDNQKKHGPSGSHETKPTGCFMARNHTTQTSQYVRCSNHGLASPNSVSTSSQTTAIMPEPKSQPAPFSLEFSSAVPQVPKYTCAGDTEAPDQARSSRKGPKLGKLIDLDPDSAQTTMAGNADYDTTLRKSSVAPTYSDLLPSDTVDLSEIQRRSCTALSDMDPHMETAVIPRAGLDGNLVSSSDYTSEDLTDKSETDSTVRLQAESKMLPSSRLTKNSIQVEEGDLDVREEILHVEVVVKPSMLTELENLTPMQSGCF